MNCFIASLAAFWPPFAHASFAMTVLSSLCTHGGASAACAGVSVATPSATKMAVSDAKIPSLAMAGNPLDGLGRASILAIQPKKRNYEEHLDLFLSSFLIALSSSLACLITFDL